jgi:hypothetical protein
MSDIVNIKKTRRVVTTTHRVTFELVPRDVMEELFHSAIAVGWAADEDAYSARDGQSAERLSSLMRAVGKASQYTVPEERVVDEPV